MEMPISVRLDKKTETLLEETAKVLRVNKTQVIKGSLSDYCSHIRANCKSIFLWFYKLTTNGKSK